MNDRLRRPLAWLAVAAGVLFGLLLLYSARSEAHPATNPARPGVSWPVVQTIVAFALFDIALLAGLVVARLRSRPTSLSPKGLLATAAGAAILSLVLLVIALDWPLSLTILLWTLVLVAGFALLLALGMVWTSARGVSEPAQPPAEAQAQDQIVDETPVHEAEATPAQEPGETSAQEVGVALARRVDETPTQEAEAPVGGAEATPVQEAGVPLEVLPPGASAPLTALVVLLGGDREAAEQRIAMEQTLDPGASRQESVARALYKAASEHA